MIKLNLVIDASGIFYRSLFTVGNFGENKQKLLGSKKSQEVFMRKLAADFSSLVKLIDDPCRTIICLDSTSWRKNIMINDGDGYKSNREKDEKDEVNWDAFFDITAKFAEILSHKGYIISKIPGAEADDLMYFWSRKLNDMNENVIIVTGDRDLLQVLQKTENGNWTIALDPVLSRQKISLTQETLDLINSTTPKSSSNISIFDPGSWESTDELLKKILDRFELNIIDIRSFLVQKVILGDGGDAVPSCVTWLSKNKKNEEVIKKMTDSNYSKVLFNLPALNTATWRDFLDCPDAWVESICSTMEGLKNITVDRAKVKNSLKRNCVLVILHTEIIPNEIQLAFEKEHDLVPESLAITGRDALLSGTEWWSTDKAKFVPKSFDLFE